MAREDWDDIKYVLAVAETGTVSAAARRLGVNHATVLRRIAQYEEEAGAPLFEKTPKGYALAPDRLRLIEAMREVDRSVQAVQRMVAGVRAPVSGDVRVTSTDSLCQIVLPSVVARIAGRAPELLVTLVSSNAHLDLGRIHADITIRPARILPDDLVGTEVGQLRFAAYRAKGGGADGWLGLAGQLSRSAPGRWLEGEMGTATVGPGADSFLTLREMAALGLGIAILPDYLGRDDARLEPVEGALPDLQVPVWVACHPDLAEVPRIALMRQYLVEELKADATAIFG
ncbi:LysR family transcriptional regulator [Frigidibacter sp. RF13]|uniref:LysR family transcriptional regulator n=1 Tax=Frigidibacter sp. RF13 TaxID=2997340 RepID=UPI0022721D1D|nr:LysR family transcriptional regulator [Frigidibacter sp. RF13]